MAQEETCTPAIDCNNNYISKETKLKSLLFVDGDGCVGVAFKLKAVSCSELTPLINCNNQDLTIDQILNLLISLDDCGNPSITVFYESEVR